MCPNHRWIRFYVVATVVSTVVMGLKIMVFVLQLQERCNILRSLEDGETDNPKSSGPIESD